MMRTQGICKHCGAGFVGRRHWQVFCSVKCKNMFHVNVRRKAMEMYQRTQEAGDGNS
jgi:hypothetical protein